MGTPVNSKLSERLAVVATSLPTTNATNGFTLTSSAVNIAATSGNFFGRYFGIAQVNTTATCTITVIKGSDSAVTLGTAIATQTNGSTATPVVVFDINGATENLNDSANTYLAIRIVNTQATVGASAAAALIIGGDGRFDPAFTYNSSGVNATIPSV